MCYSNTVGKKCCSTGLCSNFRTGLGRALSLHCSFQLKARLNQCGGLTNCQRVHLLVALTLATLTSIAPRFLGNNRLCWPAGSECEWSLVRKGAQTSFREVDEGVRRKCMAGWTRAFHWPYAQAGVNPDTLKGSLESCSLHVPNTVTDFVPSFIIHGVGEHHNR